MALEGNLSSFGLSEILQLISVQQKTGMLTVSSDDKNTVMFFRDGEIVSTRDRRRRARDPFKEYLTRYGVLDRDQLLRISQIASQSKLDLIDILASEGFMTEKELESQWHKQIHEAMHDVLTWDQCSYKFISSEDIVEGIRSVGTFSIEAMLMESMRRIDEFPRMLEAFPNEQVLITRVDGDAPDEDETTTNERAVLEVLVDIVSLHDLITRAKLPEFEVYEALKLLKDKNLIKVKDEQPTENVASKRTPGKVVQKKRIGNILPFVAALVLFSGAFAVGFKDAIRFASPDARLGVAVFEDPQLKRARFEHRLRWLIEAHRAEQGVYPGSLEELESSGFANERVIKEAKAYEFRYRLTPGRLAYTLL